MNIFLQSNELLTDVWWLLGFGILVIALLLTLRHFRARQVIRRKKRHDPRAANINETNYNINRAGIEEHRTAAKTEAEAQKALEALREAEELPSNEEFAALRRELKKS